MTRIPVAAIALLAAFPMLSGCSQEEKPDYDPGVTAADFVMGIDNPYLPFKPGAWWRYEATTEDGMETIEVQVLEATKTIMGVKATVVRDTVKLDGEVIEDTYDWYGQDKTGNVWYLGEDTAEYEDGVVVSTEGAWEWGVDGALPGVVMWAKPVADDKPYFQEFYWDEAVDEASVIALGRQVKVQAGTFTDTVTTREWTRLDPDVSEIAHYARSVGVVLKAPEGGGMLEGEELVAYHVPK